MDISDPTKPSNDSPTISKVNEITADEKNSPMVDGGDSNILIKREAAEAVDCSCNGQEVTPFTKNDPSEVKQLLNPETTSKWSSEDTRDDLKLTAYDVIAGVISTHPIKPLEPEAVESSNAHSTSPASTVVTKLSSVATPTPPPTLSVSTPSKEHHHSLVQDLDEFTKVMHQVTQEQIAKERRDSLASEFEAVYDSHMLSPPPYNAAVGRPVSLKLQSRNFYQQGYTLSPSQPQVKKPFQPRTVMKPKSQPILPSTCMLSDPSPSSCSNQVPHTPTTPLEHFSTFQPPPPPLATPMPPHQQSSGPQACAYSSSAVPYPYSSVHQPISSSISETWRQSAVQHSVLAQPHTCSQQGNLKETILAHVSSHIVAIAGQKRPIQEPVVPPPKVSSMLNSTLHQYHPLPPVGTTFGNPSVPSVSFPPHQPL